MKVHLLFLLLLLFSIAALPVSAQETTPEPTVIAPSDDDRSIYDVGLSPDGAHVAVMTIDPFAETYFEVRSTTEDARPIIFYKDLFQFDGFVWSPNSRYLAVTGNRNNCCAHEYNLVIFDVLENVRDDGAAFSLLGRFFAEVVDFDDPGVTPDYAPVWSADSTIIAINFRDGIHFYDIINCPGNDCPLLYLLPIGYVPWFDWRGNTLITRGDNSVNMWDVSAVYHPQ